MYNVSVVCLVVVLSFNIYNFLYVHLADIVECEENPNACQDHARCNNTDGGFDCVCNGGFEGMGALCLGMFYPVA